MRSTGGTTGGEDLIQLLAVLGPAVIDRGEGQLSFGLKEVVKAALLHPCPVANMIHRGAAIAARPDQFDHGVNQAIFGGGGSSHGGFGKVADP